MRNRTVRLPPKLLLAGVCFTSLGLTPPLAASTPAAPEPNFELASQWWPELPNKWTAVGWRDHLYRFNVLYNGTLMNFPVRQNRRR